jgi:GAF domain-containing protein
MAEVRRDYPADRRQAYAQLKAELMSVLADETSRTARMATTVAMLRAAFGERFFWCGFYEVDPAQPNELVVGPYQGTLGCLRIPFGRGVCGAAAQRRETIIVPDVHAFPGHIACDSRSNSEIVVPVLDRAGRLHAVLDVDSTDFAAFDAIDDEGLTSIIDVMMSR